MLLFLAALSPPEAPADGGLEVQVQQCSTFYNDEVKYVREPSPSEFHSSWTGSVIYDPEEIEWIMQVGEAEVTGTPHNEWQDGFVPKVNHTECGGSGGHLMMGGSHH